MFREDGWLARMAAYFPAVITGTCAVLVLTEPLRVSSRQNLGGALLSLFFMVFNRETVGAFLVATLLYLMVSLVVDAESRSAPKFKHAVGGNSIVVVCVLGALWFGNDSTWLWSVIFVAGVVTSIAFRRRFGDHLLF